MLIWLSLFTEEDLPSTNFESGRPATLRDVRYEEACNRLAVEAVKRGCTDNVTVVMIDILHPSNEKDSLLSGELLDTV